MTLQEFNTAHPDFFSWMRASYGKNPRALRSLVAGRYLIVGYDHRGLREYRIFAAGTCGVIEVPGAPLATADAAIRHAHWHNYERAN